jgi:hypothetical protein
MQKLDMNNYKKIKVVAMASHFLRLSARMPVLPRTTALVCLQHGGEY